MPCPHRLLWFSFHVQLSPCRAPYLPQGQASIRENTTRNIHAQFVRLGVRLSLVFLYQNRESKYHHCIALLRKVEFNKTFSPDISSIDYHCFFYSFTVNEKLNKQENVVTYEHYLFCYNQNLKSHYKILYLPFTGIA